MSRGDWVMAAPCVELHLLDSIGVSHPTNLAQSHQSLCTCGDVLLEDHNLFATNALVTRTGKIPIFHSMRVTAMITYMTA